ncbi:UDP-N-acetylgalactosamine-undecaprenyl-phosphate N-acetylgalactosaminephosphotransferase [bacterium BMS3Bbin01]|nr:UDP-N-acetylgalactosamine-undecaprenyl-phosphate N-acetylgalactosaminephosphotransferase [bacterium BMS3Bbin01]
MRNRFLARTAVLDLLSLAVGVLAASMIVFDRLLPWQFRPDVWPMLSYLLVGLLLGTVFSARTWGTSVPRPSYGRAVSIVVLSVGLTALLLIGSRSYFSRPFIAYAAGVWLAASLVHRAIARSRPWSERMVLITEQKEFLDHLRLAPHADIINVLDPHGSNGAAPLHDGESLAVDLREVLSESMARYVASTSLAGFPVRSLANVYEEHTGRLALAHISEGWEVSAPLHRASSYNPAKRIVDMILVLAVSPIVLVLSAIIWVAVRIDSKGKAIFKQQRVGRNGELFTLYKFRTMIDGADENGPKFAVVDDDRLTRVGRFLRRFRADELPQLLNVLKGDLSLVGPRPEQPEFVDGFVRTIPFYAYRHLIRPGVTGWAQVNYGYADDEADTVEKLTYDLYYVKHMSLWLDLDVLGKSIWTVLSGFGAQ